VRCDDEIGNEAPLGVVAGKLVKGIIDRQEIQVVQADLDALDVEGAPERLLDAVGIAEIDQNEIAAVVEIRNLLIVGREVILP